jgi:hypothetical protein
MSVKILICKIAAGKIWFSRRGDLISPSSHVMDGGQLARCGRDQIHTYTYTYTYTPSDKTGRAGDEEKKKWERREAGVEDMVRDLAWMGMCVGHWVGRIHVLPSKRRLQASTDR